MKPTLLVKTWKQDSNNQNIFQQVLATPPRKSSETLRSQKMKKNQTTIKSIQLKFANMQVIRKILTAVRKINQPKLTQIHTIESAAEISKVTAVCSPSL